VASCRHQPHISSLLLRQAPTQTRHAGTTVTVSDNINATMVSPAPGNGRLGYQTAAIVNAISVEMARLMTFTISLANAPVKLRRACSACHSATDLPRAASFSR
jgi:hypothetical protein